MKYQEMFTDYKVADIELADWGRLFFSIAESEMPALLSFLSFFFF